MISIARSWENFNSITIDINDYNKLLNFLYEINDKLFDEVKLLSSRNGEFTYLKDLNIEYNINEEIKNGAKEFFGLKYDEKILNDKIKINILKISIYSIDDLLKEINQFLNNNDNKEFDRYKKNELCKILINFIPKLESNDENDKIFNIHKDIRSIYGSVCKILLKEEIIQTQVNSIWTSVDKYIMIFTQEYLDDKKKMDIESDNNYIEILNKYQDHFDFNKYNLIPNAYGDFLNIKDFEDYNCVPEEILNGIKITFSRDLKQKSPCQNLNIKGIKKNSIKDLGEIIEQCFDNKRKVEDNYFNYRNTYGICKIIIKYIPMNGRKKEYQMRLYNLYKLFNKNIGEPIEIESNENLYSDINNGIIQYINEQICYASSVAKTKEFTDDIFNLINENSDLLDPKNIQ